MEDYQPSEMEDGEYLPLDLQRSDGRSRSSSEIEDDSATPSPSRFPSEQDSSDGGSSVSFDERSPFLEDCVESGGSGNFLSSLQTDSGVVEVPGILLPAEFASNIPGEPRQSPDGCSISSSSSDSCLLQDVVD